MGTRDWLQLALTEGIGPILTSRLVEAAGSAAAACAADHDLLRSIEGIGNAKASQIRDSLRRAQAEVDAEISRAQAAGVQIISLDDAAYPPMLKAISDAPPVLYVRGNLEPRDLNAIAVVGSRRCSHYGREQAERFAELLAGAGFTVVSGGARGVDSAAHRGAIAQTSGRTIAVLGCGVDVAYPPENESLFAQIAHRGAVVSEFPIAAPPLRENFPRRNRIISGLSRGVLVIEADIASGALITARLACDAHNRPVFAIPGRIDNAMSAGPHALIRDGAILVTKLDEIVENLGPLPHDIADSIAPTTPSDPPVSPDPGLFQNLDDQHKKVLEVIDSDATSLDAIIARTDLPAEAVMQALTMLSLRGAVRRVDGQKYLRTGHAGAQNQ